MELRGFTMLGSAVDRLISDELYIHQYRNGVKLVRPYQIAPSSMLLHEWYTIGHAATLSFSFCLLNTNSEIIRMNAAGAELNGYVSEKDVIGKSLFDMFERSNAHELRNHDIAILNAKKTSISVNKTTRKDGKDFNNIIIDAPCYGDDDELIGILGFSAEIGSQSIVPAFNYLCDLGLIKSSKPTSIENIQLTNREKECLDQLMCGKSYKQIADDLCISPRTVEHSIERVKAKVGVRTKFQLIDFMQAFY